MAIICLIKPEAGKIETGPGCEDKTEHEDLIEPTVVKGLTEHSPSSFDKWFGVKFRDDLYLSAWMKDKLPNVGLTVCEKGIVGKDLGVYYLMLL